MTYRKDSHTAGNSLCRAQNRCGYHGYKFSWCYVSTTTKAWDYCCTGSCGFHGKSYEWCRSGTKWQYCGSGSAVDDKDRRCDSNCQCGLHLEYGKTTYYWCSRNQGTQVGRCCQPWHKCGRHGYSFNWCYTGYRKATQWKRCVP